MSSNESRPIVKEEERDAGVAGGESVAWLAEVCKRDDSLATGRPLFAHAWTVGDRTLATNGHRMVELRGAFGFPEASPDQAKTLLRVMDEEFDGEGVPVDLASLRTFVGADQPLAPPLADCPTCENTGAINCDNCDEDDADTCICPDCGDEHDCRCDACNGEGEIDCPDCPRGKPSPVDHGRIFGHLFNRLVLRVPLHYLKGDTARWFAKTPERAHRLDGDGWRLIVMPLRDTDEPRRIAPQFPTAAPTTRAVEVSHD